MARGAVLPTGWVPGYLRGADFYVGVPDDKTLPISAVKLQLWPHTDGYTRFCLLLAMLAPPRVWYIVDFKDMRRLPSTSPGICRVNSTGQQDRVEREVLF